VPVEQSGFQVNVNSWTSSEVRSLKCPFPAHEVTMPPQEGLWFGQQHTLPQTVVKMQGYPFESVREGDEHQFFRS
jgi:hypothetical protein